MRARLSALAVATALAALAWGALVARERVLDTIAHGDATPTAAVTLPGGTGPGLSPAARTRVVVIDGLSAEVAATLPVLQALCKRGLAVVVDVGFPTVSLPVEVALWSGLTQQQTGFMNRDERPLAPPLVGIPSRVPASRAVAESHGWIARSLGFAATEPAADPADAVSDAGPELWQAAWRGHATAAVASNARLVFVHILRVDAAGHVHGSASPEYRTAAIEADAVLGELLAHDLGARWFALSDHGHLGGARGGHGGEERDVRQVIGCIAGPGVTATRGGLVHIADLARAIADSTGVALDVRSPGRPLTVALRAPLSPEDALPAMTLGAGAIALLVFGIGVGVTLVTARRWWLAPWWFVTAWVALVMLRGEPTLSTPFAYRAHGRDMLMIWLPLATLAFAATVVGVRRARLVRVVAAQLAIPFAAAAASLAACGGWPAVFGDPFAPVVPRFTAYALALLLLAALGAATVALATLTRAVLGQRGSPGAGPDSPQPSPQ